MTSIINFSHIWSVIQLDAASCLQQCKNYFKNPSKFFQSYDHKCTAIFLWFTVYWVAHAARATANYRDHTQTHCVHVHVQWTDKTGPAHSFLLWLFRSATNNRHDIMNDAQTTRVTEQTSIWQLTPHHLPCPLPQPHGLRRANWKHMAFRGHTFLSCPRPHCLPERPTN